MSVIVASFYKFVNLSDVETLQQPLLDLCKKGEIKGTILLAEEGINGNIAGEKRAIDAVINYLKNKPYFQDLEIKTCQVEKMPFVRTKVKIKNEIITFNEPSVDPTKQVGKYISPENWNELISNPEVTVIDTRNEYEVNIGTFQRAENPHIDSFTKFKEYIKNNLDPKKHQKVALFCTGGIRCEKATSLMLSEGFQEVYHLKGGILKYLQEIPSQNSLWEGECFVFDQRVALKQGLKSGSYQLCPNCGIPIPKDSENTVSNHICEKE